MKTDNPQTENTEPPNPPGISYGVYEFPLRLYDRKCFRVYLRLPHDITPDELTRLAEFIRLLPRA
jgi:hypothetical protein